MHPYLFTAFADELQKIAAGEAAVVKEAPAVVEGAARALKVPWKGLGIAGVGAAGLYGAQRLGKDIMLGEQQRRMMRSSGMGFGGGYY
jgi:hypothetical protein